MKEYHRTRLWLRRLFWVLLLIYLPTYFITRFRNTDEKMQFEIRVLDSIFPIPTYKVKWETYVMTSAQINEYLTKNTSPKQISRNQVAQDPNGDYFLLFRFLTKNRRYYYGQVKFYVDGVDFPIEYMVNPGKKEFKDYFIPIHVDPAKFKSAPNATVKWKVISSI